MESNHIINMDLQDGYGKEARKKCGFLTTASKVMNFFFWFGVSLLVILANIMIMQQIYINDNIINNIKLPAPELDLDPKITL